MKIRNGIRLSCLTLAVMTFTAVFAGCGNTTTPNAAETTAAPVATEAQSNAPEVTTESNLDKNGYLKDKIGDDVKFNTTLRMLYWSDVENKEFFVEDTTGELVNDSIYTRNLTVEERLQVKFEYVGTKGNFDNNAAYVKFAKNAQAGGEAYDIYASYSMTTAACAYEGLCRNLLQYDVMDFTAPWWPPLLVEEAKIAGKLFFTSGDLSTNLLYMMYPLYFNKDLISNYNLESPYELVKNNEWTFEKMFKMCEDTFGNGVTQETGYYAYVQNSTVHCDPWFYAAGLRTVDRDNEGALVLSEQWGSETAAAVAEAVQKLMSSDYSDIKNSGKASFKSGMSLFMCDRARYASSSLASVDFEYGVVPLPKYSKDQESYATCLGFPATFYAISVTSTQPEAAATTLECLSSEGYRTITPNLFEITMKSKYVSDSDAGQMFDIVKATVSFDVGRIYTSQLNNLSYSIFRNFVASSTVGASYTSSYTANVKSLKKTLDKMQTKFAEIEG